MVRKVVYPASILLSVVAALGLYSFRYDLHDWWVLRSYQPPEQVEYLSERTSLTDYGQQLFYVHDPQVLSSEEFNTVCTGNNREASVVLGCYADKTIYIYNVDNEMLDGIKEITAAHEMLHAAYERLSQAEKDTLSEWLYVARDRLANQRILNTIATYGDLPEEARLNELHSIIGTEVRDIPEYLEDHYAQYFDNRLTVVEFSERYEAVFAEIEQQIATYDKQLAGLKLEIRALEIQLEQDAGELSQSQQQLENLLNRGDTQGYNQLVPSYNSSVNQYNAKVASLKAKISTFNEVVAARNELGAEQNDLAQSIDSRFNEVEKQ